MKKATKVAFTETKLRKRFFFRVCLLVLFEFILCMSLVLGVTTTMFIYVGELEFTQEKIQSRSFRMVCVCVCLKQSIETIVVQQCTVLCIAQIAKHKSQYKQQCVFVVVVTTTLSRYQCQSSFLRNFFSVVLMVFIVFFLQPNI